MTVEELMINDWVQSSSGKYCKYKFPTSDYGHLDGMLLMEDSKGDRYFTGFEDISPIPLTKEILEKNGFVYHKGEKSVFGVTTAPYYVYEEFPRIYCDGNPFSVWFEEEVSIEYVHQLQHVLRLCEINKEIEL